MRRRRLVALSGSLVAMAGMAALDAPAASACSCAPLELDRATFRAHDGAINGKLIEVKIADAGPRTVDMRFRVERVFAGKRRIADGSVIKVRTGALGLNCGLETRLGQRKGLFLDRSGGHWRSTICQATSPRSMRRAAADLGYARTRGC